ncbi:MAG: carboxypeptidase-like regulatory domain-containing protein, partial [Gemmatimonadaceae bacterium]
MKTPGPEAVRVIVFFAGSVIAGCRAQEPFVCTDILVPGIVVDVRDSISDAYVGPQARIAATSGGYLNVVVTQDDDGPYALAHERPGTYTVTVDKTGYTQWRRAGVHVTADECHV